MSSNSVAFAPAILRGLTTLGTTDGSTPDLALELGLSAWIRGSEVDLEGAQGQMLAIREAVLDAGRMDRVSEPVPFGGRTARLDALQFAAYLGTLIERAARSERCDPSLIVERAIDRLNQ